MLIIQSSFERCCERSYVFKRFSQKKHQSKGTERMQVSSVELDSLIKSSISYLLSYMSQAINIVDLVSINA